VGSALRGRGVVQVPGQGLQDWQEVASLAEPWHSEILSFYEIESPWLSLPLEQAGERRSSGGGWAGVCGSVAGKVGRKHLGEANLQLHG
jgi:hypothetical protein